MSQLKRRHEKRLNLFVGYAIARSYKVKSLPYADTIDCFSMVSEFLREMFCVEIRCYPAQYRGIDVVLKNLKKYHEYAYEMFEKLLLEELVIIENIDMMANDIVLICDLDHNTLYGNKAFGILLHNGHFLTITDSETVNILKLRHYEIKRVFRCLKK